MVGWPAIAPYASWQAVCRVSLDTSGDYSRDFIIELCLAYFGRSSSNTASCTPGPPCFQAPTPKFIICQRAGLA